MMFVVVFVAVSAGVLTLIKRAGRSYHCPVRRCDREFSDRDERDRHYVRSHLS